MNYELFNDTPKWHAVVQKIYGSLTSERIYLSDYIGTEAPLGFIVPLNVLVTLETPTYRL